MKNTPKNGWVFGLHVKWLSENMYNLKNMPNSISAGAFLSLSLSKTIYTPTPLYSITPKHPVWCKIFFIYVFTRNKHCLMSLSCFVIFFYMNLSIGGQQKPKPKFHLVTWDKPCFTQMFQNYLITSSQIHPNSYS